MAADGPMRTYMVAWAASDGTFVGRPQKVQAQRLTMERVGPAVVFLFQLVDGTGRLVNVLTVPYERVHSIDMAMGEE
jgi:hypothetical protein